MTLDEIEKLAREETEDPITGTKQRDYRGSMRAYHLSRALLLVMPVVRAAEIAADYMRKHSEPRTDWACTECAPNEEIPDHLVGFRCHHHGLLNAIDTMRAALTKETK